MRTVAPKKLRRTPVCGRVHPTSNLRVRKPVVQFEFDISSEINRIQEQLNKLIEQVTAHVWDKSLDREQFYRLWMFTRIQSR